MLHAERVGNDHLDAGEVRLAAILSGVAVGVDVEPDEFRLGKEVFRKIGEITCCECTLSFQSLFPQAFHFPYQWL